MSNILKGIINETSPHNYDSDWDYQDAVARSGKSRSSYRSQEDDTSDADIAYSKKMYQLGQQQKRDADHDRLATGTNEDDSNQTRMRMNDYYDLAEALQEKLRQAIKFGDNELVHKLSKERAELDARVKKYGLMPESEQLDEISNEKLTQYKTAAAADASKADKEGDFKRGDKRFSGIVKATKKQFANDTKKSGISQGISEDRFNSKQEVINHFVKNGKSAAAGAAAWERGYRGSSKKPIELKKPPQKSYHDELDDKRYSTFENLGDQLKSKSLEALVQAKLAIEQQREAEIEAWKQDFEKNTVQKAQQDLRREFQPTPVAQPGEKHSVLKARLSQLNSAIQKQQLLDKLVDRIERKGLLTPAMQNDTDTSMHVKYGAKDNYQSLNKKLDNAISMLQDRLYIRKKSGLKEDPLKDVDEGWSQKYKSSINCSHPKGFSQKAHCAGKKKHNESIDDVMEMTCPDCGMCETHGDNSKDQLDELKCWSGYHRVAGTKAGFPGSCAKNKTNEEQHSESCPHCGGEMVSEELMNEKKDACYYKVKSRYKVWPSAYASGALVKCRKSGADSWGNGGKKNESSILEGIEQADESLHDWFNKEKWVRMDTKGKIKGPCAREPGEGKPKCLPQSKAHSLGKKGRASAAQRKRREDPNPERSGKAINVDTKKKD